jgi:hypothetical protein
LTHRPCCHHPYHRHHHHDHHNHLTHFYRPFLTLLSRCCSSSHCHLSLLLLLLLFSTLPLRTCCSSFSCPMTQQQQQPQVLSFRFLLLQGVRSADRDLSLL